MTGGAVPERNPNTVAERRDHPGVSTFDLICGPQVQETCREHIGRWARDRALSTKATDRLCVVTSAALGHGLRYGPRGVSVTLRWADLDRVRVGLRWHDVTGLAHARVSNQDLEATAAFMDAVAESWVFGAGSPGAQWLVVDTRA